MDDKKLDEIIDLLKAIHKESREANVRMYELLNKM